MRRNERKSGGVPTEGRVGGRVEAKNAYVRREQEVMKSMMGERPRVPAEMERFDAYMSNNGEHAQDFCEKLTAGIDKKAFPVC
jgi:hypothetical protein